MKNRIVSALLVLLASSVMAQTPPAPERADGVVRKIDRDAKKITIRHGEIKNLDMPAMTMVFQVEDAALLDKVKPGDTIQFRAEKSGGGAFIASDIAPVAR